MCSLALELEEGSCSIKIGHLEKVWFPVYNHITDCIQRGNKVVESYTPVELASADSVKSEVPEHGGVSCTRLTDERLGDESPVREKSSGMEVMVVISSKDGE